jgi:hypothetical protein
LWITTPEAAELQLLIRTYPVSDLIRVAPAPGESAYDYYSLINAIRSAIAPDAWTNVGGPATVEGIYGTLVVTATEEIHDQIRLLLDAYRAALKQLAGGEAHTGPIIIENRSGVHDRIRAALDKPIALEMIEEPLANAVEAIAKHADINVMLDSYGLEDWGMSADTKVTASVKGIPLRNALRHVLHNLDLTYCIRDEALVITTPDGAESRLSIVMYPVHDLVPVVSGPGDDPPEKDFDTLIEVLTSNIHADSWEDVGGPGVILALTRPALLLVSQPDAIHEEIQTLLGQLRQAKHAERQSVNETVDDASTLIRPTTIQVYHLAIDARGEPIFPAVEVMALVQRAVEPRSWTSEANVFALVVGNSLVIRHHDQVHRQVQQLLTKVGAWNPGYGGMGGLGGGMGGMGGGMGSFGGGGMGGLGGASGESTAQPDANEDRPTTNSGNTGGFF